MTVTVSDGGGGSVSDTIVVTINNVAPTLTLNSPVGSDLYQVVDQVNFLGEITNPGNDDTHTYAARQQAH